MEKLIYRPKPINDVLVNPGMGWTTFQRVNGEQSETGEWWDEGYLPGRYADTGLETAPDHPLCSMAYFRIYWGVLEPEDGERHWELIDDILSRAAAHGQCVTLRLMPHGYSPFPPHKYCREVGMTYYDVPSWYRRLIGDEGYAMTNKQLCDPENPLYLARFGGLVREMGRRYDGDPRIDTIDVSLWRAWGESSGSELPSEKLRDELLACYTETFRHTRLLMMPDTVMHRHSPSPLPIGWRLDSLGLMNPFDTPENLGSPRSLMLDNYPFDIVRRGLAENWKTAPAHFEVSGVMKYWDELNFDTDFCIQQSLKWHMSVFNNKNSPVPEKLRPKVDDWLRRMGYRYALRRIEFPSEVTPGGVMPLDFWFENTGVAPCYRPFRLALRLDGERGRALLFPASAQSDPRTWLPGDTVFGENLTVPDNLAAGTYTLSLALLWQNGGNPFGGVDTPAVHLANVGEDKDGWCFAGRVEVRSRD